MIKEEEVQPKRALVFSKLVQSTENSNIMEVPYHKGATKRTAPLQQGGKRCMIRVFRPDKSPSMDASTSYQVTGEMTVGELKHKIAQKEGIGAHLQQARRHLGILSDPPDPLFSIF